jgi:hypothetical protein
MVSAQKYSENNGVRLWLTFGQPIAAGAESAARKPDAR